MPSLPSFRRSHRIVTSLFGGIALAVVLGALCWHSPTARADSSGGSSPGGTGANLPSGWTQCSAGSAIADPNGAHGLFVANVNRDWNTGADSTINTAIGTYLPSDPTICGFTVVIPWSAIDKGPCLTGDGPPFRLCVGYQQYDWTFLDDAVSQWTTNKDGTSNGKIVNLSVWGAKEGSGVNFLGGNDTMWKEDTAATPQYVLDKLSSESPSRVIPSTSCSAGDPAGTPVYWDSAYKTNWQAFQQALVNHVNGNANIGYIRFGLGSGDEDFPVRGVDDGSTCQSAWAKAGLNTMVMSCSCPEWQYWSTSQVAYEATLGSVHPILVALGPGADPLARAVASEAQSQNMKGANMGIGMEGMSQGFESTPPGTAGCTADWCTPFANNEGKLPLYMQEYVQSAPNDSCPGKVCMGSLSPLISYMVTVAHAQVIELYPQEWLVADDPAWSPKTGSYASYHGANASALGQAACEVGGQAGIDLVCGPTPPSSLPLP